MLIKTVVFDAKQELYESSIPLETVQLGWCATLVLCQKTWPEHHSAAVESLGQHVQYTTE